MTGVSVREVLSTVRTAQGDVERADSALSDAVFALSRLDPDQAAIHAIADTEQLHRLNRVIDSLITRDGVFDLNDLATAKEDLRRAVDEMDRKQD